MGGTCYQTVQRQRQGKPKMVQRPAKRARVSDQRTVTHRASVNFEKDRREKLIAHVSNVTEPQPQHSQRRSSSDPTVTYFAQPVWACRVYSMFTDEPHKLDVIFGPKGQSPINIVDFRNKSLYFYFRLQLVMKNENTVAYGGHGLSRTYFDQERSTNRTSGRTVIVTSVGCAHL